MNSEEFKKLTAELQEEVNVDKVIMMASYLAAAMSGEMILILKEKGIITDEDFKRMEKAGIDAGERLKEQYESIGKEKK